MIKRKNVNKVVIGIAVFLLCFPAFLRSENIAKGNIVGFVYDEDGTTPFEGAVVKVKNISTGAIFESSKSDANGVFKIEEVETGLYLYRVLTAQGEFSSENFFGVRISEGDTAKLSISLTPYEQKVASAIQEVYKEQSISGEALVGTVIDYNFDTKTAEVLVVKGLLQMNDRIHAKGKATDFYQDVEELKLGHSPVKKIFAGQTANLSMKKSVKNGDLVYVVCRRGILPIFLKPLGLASIIAGSAGTIAIMAKNLNEKAETCSGFKPKK